MNTTGTKNLKGTVMRAYSTDVSCGNVAPPEAASASSLEFPRPTAFPYWSLTNGQSLAAAGAFV